jgi:OOP family OmpA-OmpF porin
MKRIPFLLLILLNGLNLNGQNPGNKDGLTFKTLWADYTNPNGGDLSDYKPYRYGFSAAYTRNINHIFNISVPVRFLNGKLKDQPTNSFVAGGDIQLHAQYFKQEHRVVPYFVAGIGTHFIQNEGADVQIPVGLGVDIKMFERGYFTFSTEYRFSLTKDRNNFIHGLGFKYLLGKANKIKDLDGDGIADELDDCPTIKGLPEFKGCPDTDGDGIPDHLDDCPDVAGTIGTKGCPDRDSDGIPDNIDECPDQFGPKSNNGCPILDRDGDGINDDKDKCPDLAGVKSADGCPDMDGDGVADHLDECPDVAGLAKFNGCPDTDGDGVEDRYDRCPTVPGTIANKGCPEIKKEDKQKLEFAMQAVQFELGKTTLLSSSFSILNDIADIMKRYPDYKLTISGHTDPSGKIETNRKLSTNRAKACYTYLVSKGISTGRMEYIGYGPDKPRFDNTTEEGRVKNRRVEFSLDLK